MNKKYGYFFTIHRFIVIIPNSCSFIYYQQFIIIYKYPPPIFCALCTKYIYIRTFSGSDTIIFLSQRHACMLKSINTVFSVAFAQNASATRNHATYTHVLSNKVSVLRKTGRSQKSSTRLQTVWTLLKKRRSYKKHFSLPFFWNILSFFPQRTSHTKNTAGKNRRTERKKSFSYGRRLIFPENDKRRERL